MEVLNTLNFFMHSFNYMRKSVLKLMIKLLILLVLILSFVFYTEVNLRNINNSYKLKKQLLESKLDSIEILVLGTSESLYGINPEYFNLYGFNLSEKAQSLHYDKELLLKYINKMPKLKYVIISISYFSLWYQLQHLNDNLDYFYYHFWNFKPYNDKFFDLKKYSYIALYGTQYSQDAFRNNFKVSGITENIMSNGYFSESNEMDLKQADKQVELLIKTHSLLMRDEVLDSNITTIEEMVKEIIISGKMPVFVTTPQHNTYLRKMDRNKYNQMKNVIEGLCNKYKIKYFNYTEDTRFLNEDYFDPIHLNKRGAEKFTKILNSEIFN